jgi:hypothetical protein
LRGQWTIVSDNGQVWQPYARANLWRDWGAEATTMFGIDQVPLLEDATRLALVSASLLRPVISSRSCKEARTPCATASKATSASATLGDIRSPEIGDLKASFLAIGALQPAAGPRRKSISNALTASGCSCWTQWPAPSSKLQPTILVQTLSCMRSSAPGC